MKKLIIFDVDGTLLDTTEFIYQAYEHTLKTFSFPVSSREQFGIVMGKSLELCYQLLTNTTEVARLMEEHRVFQENNLSLSIPYPFVKEMLQTLSDQGHTLVAFTSRSKRTSLATLKQAGLFEFFTLVLSGEDVTRPKPDPEGILLAMKKLSFPASQTIMVGDTASDIIAGKKAKVKTIGVSYGQSPKSLQEARPDSVVETVKDIPSVVEK